jgi:hypothetical protein
VVLKMTDSNPSLMILPTTKHEPRRVIVQWQRALLWHGMAYLTIIVLTWCEEAFYFLHQLFSRTPEQPNYLDAAITTLIIVLVWVVSGMAIYHLVVRLNYLEQFLHVCAWCRRIDCDNKWIDLETYLSKKTVGVLSHGICPDCVLKVEAEFEKFASLDGSSADDSPADSRG